MLQNIRDNTLINQKSYIFCYEKYFRSPILPEDELKRLTLTVTNDLLKDDRLEVSSYEHCHCSK